MAESKSTSGLPQPILGQVDRALSQEIALQIDLDGQSCWQAAAAALTILPTAEYVEGWVVDLEQGLAFEHAWLQAAERIVDPTGWQKLLAYFPAANFRATQLSAAGEGFPLTHRPGWKASHSPAASDDPDFWAAWEAATKLAEGRKRKKLWRSWLRWLDLLSERRK